MLVGPFRSPERAGSIRPHIRSSGASRLACSTSYAARHAKISDVTLRAFSFALLLIAGIFPYPVLAADSKAEAMAGAILFRDKGCAHCHGANGEGTQKAPALANIRKNKFWTSAKITEQIQNGGQKMPPFSDALTDAQTAQVVTFLRAKHWPLPPPAPPAPPASPTN